MTKVLGDEVPGYDEMFTGCLVEPTEATLLTDRFISLEEAGLEEQTRMQPSHGYQNVPEYVIWWSDGEDSRWETN